MIDSEIVMGTGLRITRRQGRARRQAGARRPRRLDAHRRARARRDPAARRGRAACTSPRPTWSSRCARPLEAQVAGEGDGRRARPAAARHRALAARQRGHDRAPPRGGDASSSPPARRATACTRTRPRTSRGCPTSTPASLHTVDRDALIETVARVGRSASRDESRPVLTGILVRFEPGKIVMAATDSYRLAVKETPVSERAARARGDHPGPRAAGARAHRVGRRRAAARRAGEPRRLRRRRHLADDAPHRRPVPERTASCCPEQFEHELAAAARGAARRRAPRLADGAAQLAAAAALRRRRADRVGAVRRTSARPASRCRRRTPARRWRSASTRSSCATGSSRSTRTTVKFKLISPLRPAVLEGETRRLHCT